MSTDATWVEADGIEVRITSPGRVLFPEAGLTKLDLVEYYRRVRNEIVPQTIGRALVLHRFPRGVDEEGFYQKRAPADTPEYVATAELPSPTNEEPILYVMGSNLATIFWLVNLGAFEVNPWLSLAKSPDEPTHFVVDLDPMGGEFADVCRAALLVREALAKRGLEPTVKTSGKSGIHVMGDLPPDSTFPGSREMLAEIGFELDKKNPDTFALEERIGARRGLIYFDSNQNGYGSTIAAAYSVRPTPKATISMPLTWEEIERIPRPGDFTVKTVLSRG